MSHVPTSAGLTRREMLTRSGMGFGALGLGMLLDEEGSSSLRAAEGPTSSLAARPPQFPPRAKHVIHIFMNGGISHVDTFDPKPMLKKYEGKELPMQLKTERKTGSAFPSPFSFKQHGESGIAISEIFPHLGECVDDMCFVRSMHGDRPNHEPSLMLMNCGHQRLARPCLGSWLMYGLGTENQNLPGFVVLCPGGYPIKGADNWSSAFMPGVFQGTYLNPQHTEIEKLIENIENHSVSTTEQRRQLDLLYQLNQSHLERRQHEAEFEARIESFEIAYRMQSQAATAFDVSLEPKHIQEMYGPGVHARQCLIARRLVERGVRMVQLWHGAGQPWDNHDYLEKRHRALAKECDQGIAALIKDLKQRGLLDETLIVCSGEFGRTPTVELPTAGANAGTKTGRDHNHYGFTLWMAGGGVKAGHVHGATDPFGFQAVEKPVHVHDLHATLLHLMGFDHERLTYRYAGRDFSLTDVYGRVIKDILA